MPLAPRFLTFDDFRFNVPTRELLRVGKDRSATPISLGSRAADLLLLFLQRPGELVTKNEIMDAVWPNAAVEESNLTVQISGLRRALDTGRGGASSIQTVPGRGYRFTLRVTADDEALADLPSSVSGTVAPDRVEPLSEVANALPEPIPPTSAPQAVPTAAVQNPGGIGRTTRWRLFGVGVALLCAAAVLVLWRGFLTNTFDTAAIPLVTDEARQAMADFRTLPGAKAIAISRDGWGMASAARDLDAAKEEALQRCATLGKLATPEPGPCTIYAAGSEIVWPEKRLRLPWPADIHSAPLDIPFVAADLPTIPGFRQAFIDRRFRAAASHKALAIGQERFYVIGARASQAEAVRLAVERCVDFVQAPCLLVAVDGFFTVQLPKMRQVTQLFTLTAETAMSDAEKQRIATIYQRRDWRALARGGGGTWHAVAAAPSEAAAIDQAMELCAANDQGCRIYAIGNFRVADEN